MATWNVTNRDGLLSALKSAKGGDSIVLAKADYGSVAISQDFASTVTLKSATPLAAKFSSLTVHGASNVRFDGVHVDNHSNGVAYGKLVWIDYGSQNIQLVNSEVNGLVDSDYSGCAGVYVGKASNVALENNYIHDVYRGSMVFGANNVRVVENDFDRIGEDTMKYGNVDQVIITNNFSTGAFISGSHIDFMQFQGTTSSNITVSGNVVLPQAHSNIQGIFMNNGYMKNVLIENNVIHTSMVNGVYVNEGDGITVRNNTMINMNSNSTEIDLPSGATKYDNVVTKYYKQAGIYDGDLRIQTTQPSLAGYVEKYYVNGDGGLGLTLSDLGIVKGSLAENMGAAARIKALLGDVSSAPAPAPGAETPVVIYSKLGDTEIASASNVINLAPASKYEVSAATIAFSFDADTVSGTRGLLTKDAYGYEGGGHDFAAYLKDGKLNVMFESASARETFTVIGIEANHKYDLQASFGGGKVSVWLDDKLVGSASFTTNWTYNQEYLQIGAHGGWSAPGAPDFQYVFDGTISDVRIAKGVQSLAAMDTLLGSALSLDGAPGSGGEVLSAAALEKAMDAAIRYWSEEGATTKELSVLSKTDVLIGDLQGSILGRTGKQVITIDSDAAGYGWHADGGSAVEEGKVDLLSALTHEYGHLLGYDHDVMGETLSVGERDLPLNDPFL